MRACYQFGSLVIKKRAKGSDVWEFRYYEDTAVDSRTRKSCIIGTVDKYRTEAQARKAVEALFLKLNSETPLQRMAVVSFGGICDRYIQEELPERYSTRKSYLSNIELHLKPRWGDYLLDKIRPMAVEDWLKNLDMAPKSKAHIRSLMHLMYQCAARWELFTEQRNPIGLVRVKNCTRRRQRPTILTVESFQAIVSALKEPYRTMVIIAQCLGLRVSEIAALKWDDFDFDRQQLLVQRSIVNNRVDDVKTEYSHDYVPLHDSLVEVLLAWSSQAYPTEEGWVFANPMTSRPYYPTEIQKRHLRPLGVKLGLGPIGWHTFRHTYRLWLDETGAPMKVQQELMRHASIQTTMNVYGQAMPASKREDNGKVVEMVLIPARMSA
jgi:integrase